MADWNRFSKKIFLENLYKGQNLKVRKFQIHRTLESKVIKRKPTGGGTLSPPPPVLIGLRDHMVKLKIISLYIYKDLRLKSKDIRSNESRDHYHEGGNLVPRPPCGFGFEAVFHFCGLKLNISVYIRIATFR